MDDLDDKDSFLGRARRRFTAASEEEKHLREKFTDDLRFASPDGDDQWDPKVKQDRIGAGRPAMSFPRCHTFVQQVSNEARQNKPQIKFSPRLDADKDTAEVYEGLARFIQYTSDAQVAYETAIEYSAGASFGYYRFITDYADDEGDEQELKVMPVLDPLTVFGVLVPACFNREPKFAFVIEDVPKEEFKLMYPESEAVSLGWPEAEKRGDGWISENSVRVAEYWYVEETKGKRSKPKVKFCKTNGIEILQDSETDWAGSTIPIIPVLGKQLIIEGQPRLFSVVRPQKAAQQLINYSKSRIAETLSTSPISPFMVATGQIPSGKESQWANLNKILTPFLEYSPVDVQGRPVGPPQRQTFEPPIQSLSAFVAQEIDDMKATTGIFDASLGAQSNETSGQAIARRQQQANTSNLHFMDNLERSFKKAGKVIYEMIPLIYDTAREIVILGPDEAEKVVKINQEHKDAQGNPKMFDMTSGKYSLVVTMGKAYGSKRAESFDTMAQVVQTSPNTFPMVADIMFKNSDMAGADELADRFHKLLPPQLQDQPENPLPPQAQAAIGQMQQQTAAMQGDLQKLNFEKAAKVYEQQGKLAQIQAQSLADQALEKLKLENQLTIAEVSTKAQNISERMAFVEDMVKQLHGQAHDAGMQAQAQAHAQQNQQAQADATSQQSAQDAAQSQQAQQQVAQQQQQQPDGPAQA